MSTGFKVKVQSGPSSLFASPFEGCDLPMIASSTLMVAPPDNPTAADHHRSHHGIRTRPTRSLEGQAQSQAHVPFIEIISHSENRLPLTLFLNPGPLPPKVQALALFQ